MVNECELLQLNVSNDAVTNRLIYAANCSGCKDSVDAKQSCQWESLYVCAL